MIQDIAPKIFCNQYLSPAAGGQGYVVFTKGQQVLVRREDRDITLPRTEELAPGPLQYLFSIDDTPFYLAPPDPAAEPAGYRWETFGSMARFKPKWCYFACAVALHLGRWYDVNRFCGRCGGEFQRKTEERALYCPRCGNTVYPTISPAVIVGVTHGDKLLMTKYADRQDRSRYALIAGFTEIGETVEETVHREVMEEVGVKVRNLRYYKSQPWPFSSSLLLGFFCDLDGEDHVTPDGVELDEAQWISRADMRIQDEDMSLTNEMMLYFQNHEEQFR